MKVGDLCHLALAGQLAEYACTAGLKKQQLNINDFKNLYDVTLIASGIQTGVELDDVEAECIRNPSKFTQLPVGTILNTNHNPIFAPKEGNDRPKTRNSRSKSPVQMAQ